MQQKHSKKNSTRRAPMALFVAPNALLCLIVLFLVDNFALVCKSFANLFHHAGFGDLCDVVCCRPAWEIKLLARSNCHQHWVQHCDDEGNGVSVPTGKTYFLLREIHGKLRWETLQGEAFRLGQKPEKVALIILNISHYT